ncbi:dTDP-4-dehydrorhamnose reductase [Brevundimonas viscosa]|uniref:dTDP-4-dehydrorhamnose reductase n=1 Tax=Brevundimonas viscosa TaxID=871741 RepID=A0A1I6TNS1_9CAUL|nr:dTDP-4-dehydrorhamnose reductase [Brevundimonas viscosa]SFS90825.1 dTDP-4-dehydrorhamnose reductase [Brevundimonas viscosa]
MSRILVLGRSGQVATALVPRLRADGHEVEAVGRAEVDLANPLAARDAVLARRPDLVINAAAYTAVDRAEIEEAAAMALNADGPAAAAAAAASLGAPFIHFSTDYVFDGEKGEPYTETDATNPLGVYGRSKLLGEEALAAANPRSVILRTAWVCSPHGANFLKTMLRLAAEREELGVVDDQRGKPTFARDLADVAALIAPAALTSGAPDTWGVFHVASRGETTWCGFARAIMEGSLARGGPACRVRAISTEDYPTPARRPPDSRLATGHLERVYGVSMPDWREALEDCLDILLGPIKTGSIKARKTS